MPFGLHHHQVYVQRHGRHALERFHDGQADRDVGDEPSVHDVDVQQIRASALDGAHGVGE